MKPRLALSLGAWLMATVVALGAFGAHALRGRIAPDMLAVWQTAVNYHAWHALGLLAAGVLMLQFPQRAAIGYAAWLFVAGIALFSGSLYALALGASNLLGFVTPFGGVAFIAGWLVLAVALLRG